VSVPAAHDTIAERALSLLMLAVFRAAFACLATGLVVWLSHTADATALRLLTAGLIGLLAMPMLKLLAIVASALASRDWLTLGATLAVIVILLALTLRDALGA
jgi:hypothetical protein